MGFFIPILTGPMSFPKITSDLNWHDEAESLHRQGRCLRSFMHSPLYLSRRWPWTSAAIVVRRYSASHGRVANSSDDPRHSHGHQNRPTSFVIMTGPMDRCSPLASPRWASATGRSLRGRLGKMVSLNV